MYGTSFGAKASGLALVAVCAALSGCASAAPTTQVAGSPGPGWRALFNGTDLTGFRVPPGDNGHWKVIDGVIDYDAASESPADVKDLLTTESFEDFELKLDWRLKEYTGNYMMPIVLPDGSHKLDAEGKEIKESRPNADSGIYLRGISKAQVNMWAWPIGSGEVYGYRTDKTMPAEVRAAVTPKKNADKPIGEWNHFDITLKDDRLTVVLNGETVIENAFLPNLPASGPLGFQHHGAPKPNPAGSVVQFRNIYIRELP